MVSRDTFSESDLPTSSAEDRTRTVDTVTPDAACTSIPAPATGDILKNRFVLHERLASGSATCAFRALDQLRQAAGDANPWVVLKVVTAVPGEEPRALRTLRREAAISQGLEHPNLPWVRGLDHDGPHTFLCLAWLPGESLATILDKRGSRPMPPAQALNMIEGIGHALNYLHGLGITHADIKPGNILVSPEGQATLLDLGVALGPDAVDPVSAHGFTPQYASPEVLNGELPTPADDLYSLACVTYRMLAGRRAFGAGNALEATAGGARPPRPENLSEFQWGALDQALACSRADRQQSVQAFLTQLTGSPDEPAARQWNLRRWRPVAAFAAGTLAVVTGALAIATVFLNRQPAAQPATAAGPTTPSAAEDAPPPAVTQATADVSRSVAARVATDAPRRRAEPVAVLSGTPLPSAARQPDPAPRTASAPEAKVPDTGTSPAGLLPAAPDATARSVPQGALPDTAASEAGDELQVPFSSLKVRHYVEPRYPRNALTRRVPGWVEVAFTVDASGKPRDVHIVGADPQGMFDDAALTAVRRWRFHPTGGNAVTAPVHSSIRLRFDPS